MSEDQFVDSVINIVIDDILGETQTRIGDRGWWFEQIRSQFGDGIRAALHEYEENYGSREEYLDVIRMNHMFD